MLLGHRDRAHTALGYSKMFAQGLACKILFPVHGFTPPPPPHPRCNFVLGDQSYLLNKSGKFRMCWLSDSGSLCFAAEYLSPLKTCFLSLSQTWVDAVVLWLTYLFFDQRIIIWWVVILLMPGNFASFFLNLLISVMRLSSRYFFPGQTFHPPATPHPTPPLSSCLFDRCHILRNISCCLHPLCTPFCPHQTSLHLLLPQVLHVFLLTVLRPYPCHSEVAAQWSFPFCVHWFYLSSKQFLVVSWPDCHL